MVHFSMLRLRALTSHIFLLYTISRRVSMDNPFRLFIHLLLYSVVFYQNLFLVSDVVALFLVLNVEILFEICKSFVHCCDYDFYHYQPYKDTISKDNTI